MFPRGKWSNKYRSKYNAKYGRIGGIAETMERRRMETQIRPMRDETRTEAPEGRGTHG
jgi:hypothetical protein